MSKTAHIKGLHRAVSTERLEWLFKVKDVITKSCKYGLNYTDTRSVNWTHANLAYVAREYLNNL